MKDKLTLGDIERLVILGEECNELAQVICKVQRFGIDNFNPITNQKNIDRLIQEMGDVLAMLSVVGDRLEIPWEILQGASEKKLEKIKKFTKHK